MWSRDYLRPYSTWYHPKTGGRYTVLGIARVSTNGVREGTEEVVYLSHDYQGLRTRDLAEFLDGRFEPLSASVAPEG